MSILKKISQRSVDPTFYRKKFRDAVRPLRRIEESEPLTDPGALGPVEKVAVVIAHPDDEVFCSGLLCELVERGAEITVLCLTRGEGGPTGGASRSELGRVREGEMRESCSLLGVAELEFLDFVDPVAKEYRVFAPDVSVPELASRLLPFLGRADLVISHGSGGEYWHPAHVLVHDAVKRAVEDCPAAEWVTFLARRPDHPIPRLVNRDDPEFLRIDVSRWEERREAALACHRSQLGLFGRFVDGDYRDFIRKTSVESYARKKAADRDE